MIEAVDHSQQNRNLFNVNNIRAETNKNNNNITNPSSSDKLAYGSGHLKTNSASNYNEIINVNETFKRTSTNISKLDFVASNNGEISPLQSSKNNSNREKPQQSAQNYHSSSSSLSETDDDDKDGNVEEEDEGVTKICNLN
jgi:hypothetical protein